MHRMVPAALMISALSLLPLAAQAMTISFSAQLDGASERPAPVITDAFGSASMTFDTDSRALNWGITFSKLSSPFTAAHFHGPAGPEDAAAIVLSIEPPDARGGTFNTFRFGGPGGTLLGDAVRSEQESQDLLAGLWYINIHSEANPAGEIRGQVVGGPAPVPLPGAMWML